MLVDNNCCYVLFSAGSTVTLCNIYHCSAHKLYVKKSKFSSAILKIKIHAIYSKMKGTKILLTDLKYKI